jgi:hypothetical protein
MPEWKDQMISQMYADRLRNPLDVAQDTIRDRYKLPEPIAPTIPLGSHTSAARRSDGSWIERDPLGNSTGFTYRERNSGLNPYQMTALDLIREPYKPEPIKFEMPKPEPYHFEMPEPYKPEPFKFEMPEPEPYHFQMPEPYKPKPFTFANPLTENTSKLRRRCLHGNSFDDSCFLCGR